jgi:hypothetical protein
MSGVENALNGVSDVDGGGAAVNAGASGAPALHPLLASLPPPAAGPPPPDVAKRFSQYWAATREGHSLPASLRAKKAFDNPYALEEVISTFGIDDKSSAYPRAQWDPLAASERDFADVLRVRQAMEEEARRQKVGPPRAAIAFRTAGLLPGLPGHEGGGGGGGGGGDGDVKRSRFG